MSRKIYISVFVASLTISSFFLVLNNSKPDKAIYAENNNSMYVEVIFPENNIKFFSEIVDLNNYKGQSYFVNYRIKREQMRQEFKEMLWQLLQSDITDTREQAQKRWLNLSDKIAKEDEIENILKMQGYEDVVSDVNGEKVNVTVLSEGLTQQEIGNIKSIAASVSGLTQGKIQVITKL